MNETMGEKGKVPIISNVPIYRNTIVVGNGPPGSTTVEAPCEYLD
jgi:hypothetical protein